MKQKSFSVSSIGKFRNYRYQNSKETMKRNNNIQIKANCCLGSCQRSVRNKNIFQTYYQEEIEQNGFKIFVEQRRQPMILFSRVKTLHAVFYFAHHSLHILFSPHFLTFRFLFFYKQKRIYSQRMYVQIDVRLDGCLR